jgi:sigma-B regulation protein RsbU (phosphoserine phosphatase)
MREREPKTRGRRRASAARGAPADAAGGASTKPPDPTALLAAALEGEKALWAALSALLEALGVDRWAVYARTEGGRLAPRASRGLPERGGEDLLPLADAGTIELAPDSPAREALGLATVVPLRARVGPIGVLAVGPRGGGRPPADDAAFLRSAAACLAAALETAGLRDSLRHAQQRLSRQAFELQSLVDVTRELAAGSAEDAVVKRLATSFMAHFLVARCAVYLGGAESLAPAQLLGLGARTSPRSISLGSAEHAALDRARLASELPAGALRDELRAARLTLAVPLTSVRGTIEGLVAIGERASALPFGEEDLRLAEALARQGLAALHNARLQRVREEKLRQDRELQVAREIQTSLLPAKAPELGRFALAGTSRPCFEVGGDAYDWIELGGGSVALLIADVSGKGTPASLLMASAHAFVHALAGQVAPEQLVGRLDRFLFDRTQASRFVTLFYAELDAGSRRLRYVNAGHIPPFRVSASGRVSRLAAGGPAVGLLDEESSYEAGEATLDPGDLVAMVTDGVTEAPSPDDREFGDERVVEALQRHARGAAEACFGLVAAVDAWAGRQSLPDDLTVLVLEAR